MGGKFTISERLEIAPEALIQALSCLEIERNTLLCGRCGFPFRSQDVLLVFEFGSVYSTEYRCTGNCTNRIMPKPMSNSLGRFLYRREA